ncbi:MAG: hypothetical protein R3B07_06800 [Polyangiaceae bacterium]
MRSSLAGVSCLLALMVAGCSSEAGSRRGSVGGSGGSAGTAGAAGAGGTEALDPPTPPTAVTPPPVELPPRPADFSLGPMLGPPGWRQSTEPFCSPWVGNGMFTSLWSTPEAVYVTVGIHCYSLIDGAPQEYCSAPGGASESLFVNRGEGWQAIHHYTDVAEIRNFGVQGDALLSFGRESGSCAVGKSTMDGSFDCLGGRPIAYSTGGLVRGDRVFHLGTDSFSDYSLSRFANGEWSEVKSFERRDHPGVLLDLGGPLLIAGDHGLVVGVDPESGTTQTIAAPLGRYEEGAALPWGYALLSNDASGYKLVLHSAAGWKTLNLPVGDDTKLRAEASSLYVSYGDKLYRVDETGEYELVLELTQARIEDFRVNSDTEIFLSIEYPELQQYQCGRFVMTWFDGNQLHLM